VAGTESGNAEKSSSLVFVS